MLSLFTGLVPSFADVCMFFCHFCVLSPGGWQFLKCFRLKSQANLLQVEADTRRCNIVFVFEVRTLDTVIVSNQIFITVYVRMSH